MPSSGLKAGYHSHYTVVKKVAHIPCKPSEKHLIEYDEVVVFQKRQILPRYLIFFERTSAPSSPSAVGMPPPHNAAVEYQRDDTRNLASHVHAKLTILWVDPRLTGENEAMLYKMQKEMESSSREVVVLVSSDELRVWLRAHWKGCLKGGKKGEVRVITNRTRVNDGGESAGEELLSWLRTSEESGRERWSKVPCLLFCGNAQALMRLHAPRTSRTIVSDRPPDVFRFCDPKTDPKKF